MERKEKINAVIYTRYSSHTQREESIEGQLKVCHEYAKRNNINVIGEYADRAMTGTNDNRPSFQKMLEDSNKRAFQAVLVYQLDRFGRNMYEIAKNEYCLKKNNVCLLSARENINESDASNVMLKGVLMTMAEYYSVELSQKVKRGMGINAEKGLYNGGTIPLGLKVDKDKHYQIDKEKAPIVRKIFEMYNDGHTIVQIKQYLETKGLKYSNCKIRTVLGNKKYIGIYTHNGKETPNVIPQIIDNELFEDIQQKLEKNKHSRSRLKTKTEYILTTKLFCGNCKTMMVRSKWNVL